MHEHRPEKMSQELRRIIGDYIARNSNRQSLISVTDCTVSPDLKNATISVSVLPEDKTDQAYYFLERNLTDMRHYIRKHLAMRRIPFLRLVLDTGEHNRSRILDLLNEAHEADQA